MANHIPAFYAQAVISMLKHPQQDITAILQQQQLPTSLLQGTMLDFDMEVEDFGQLFMTLIKQAQQYIEPSKDDANVILDLSTYRLMFSYMLQAKTLEDAINRAAKFFIRFNPQQQSFSLKKSGDNINWNFQFPDLDHEPDISVNHFSMGQLNWLPGVTGRFCAFYFWHRLCSWLTGQFIELTSVHVNLPLLGDAKHYIEPFNAPVYFNHQYCQLSFNKRYLRSPIIRTEQELDSMLETFPAQLLSIDESQKSTAAKVRGLLGEDYRHSMPCLDEMSVRLCTTSATLHRRLRAEGTSFQKIKDGCRRDSAIRLLRSQNVNGSCIAERLGFSDASTFYRAFKKWTGKTPQEFIQQER